MSNRGSRSSSLRRRHEPSRAPTGLVLKRHPSSLNQLLYAIRGLDPVGFDATADVHAQRTDLTNRGADIVRIQTPGEQEREGSTNLFRPLPVGPCSCSTRQSRGVAVYQNAYRWHGARSVAINLGHDMRRVDSG